MTQDRTHDAAPNTPDTSDPSVPESPWADAVRRLRDNRAAMVSLWLIIALAVIAFIGPLVWPHEYDTIFRDRVGIGPSLSPFHPLGTDILGRDLAVRLMIGMRISLSVGLIATLVSLVIGVVWGAVAGYAGGRTDQIMMRIVDIIYAMPFIFFIILLTVVFGRSLLLIFLAIGAVEWLTMSRIVRGQTLSLRRMEFIEAARAAGVRPSRILFRHIVPNLMGPVVVYVTLTLPAAILAESFLSFLGLGVNEPLTSLGLLISEGRDNMSSYPWLLLLPAGTMSLMLLALNFIGDGMRDAIDPKAD